MNVCEDKRQQLRLLAGVSDMDRDAFADLLDRHASAGLYLRRVKKTYDMLLLHAKRYAYENAMMGLLEGRETKQEEDVTRYMQYCFHHFTGEELPTGRKKQAARVNQIPGESIKHWPVTIPDCIFEEIVKGDVKFHEQ